MAGKPTKANLAEHEDKTAIRLAGKDPNTKNFEVNSNALAQITMNPELKGRPLAIISIAGAFRSGKSFILNFFIRYLRNKGWENPNWFGESNTMLVGGFTYQRGCTACTQGIDVWPEVFSLPLKDGREAAVLIVDTQGLFDSDTSPDTNVKIMTVSTLFCSYQILNLKTQIEERDLEHLQLAVEFAKVAGEAKKTCSKSFQTLLFLIRDWEREFEHELGDSTEGYYKTFFGKPSQSDEVEKVKQSIPAAFENVICFLMPHPGKKVPRLLASELTNEAVDEDFRECAQQLVEKVLHPNNIVIKKTVTGRDADADYLMQLLGNVGKCFESGKIPRAKTLLETTVNTNNEDARLAGLKEYKGNMPTEEKLQQTVFDDNELEKRHVAAMKLVDEKFREIAKLGDDETIAKAFKRLEKECEKRYGEIKEKNDNKKKNMKTRVRGLLLKLPAKFEDQIQKSEDTDPDAKFKKMCSECKAGIEEKFDKKVKDFGAIAPEIQQIRAKLVSKMDAIMAAHVEVRKTQQELRKNIEESRRAKLELVEDFRKETAKYYRKFEENLEKMLYSLKEKKMKEYEQKTKMNPQTGEVEKNKEEMKRELEDLSKKAMKRNQKLEKQLVRESEACGRDFAITLQEKLSELMSRAYIKKNCFDGYVKNFFKEEVEPGIINMPDRCKSIVREKVNDKVEDLNTKNEKNKEDRSVHIDDLNLLEKIVSGWGYLLRGLGSAVTGTVKNVWNWVTGWF